MLAKESGRFNLTQARWAFGLGFSGYVLRAGLRASS